MALVLITHDRALVAAAAHKICRHVRRQVVETGAAQDIPRAASIRIPVYRYARYQSLRKIKARLASLPGVVP